LPYLQNSQNWQGCVAYGVAWVINAMGPCLAKTLTCGCCCSCGRSLQDEQNCETAIKNALTDDATGRCIYGCVYQALTSASTCFQGATKTLKIVDAKKAQSIALRKVAAKNAQAAVKHEQKDGESVVDKK